MLVKDILTTPFVALKYLTNGDTTGLTPEQIEKADKWAECFEIDKVENFMGNETLSYKITESLIEDMDFEDETDVVN